MYAIVQTADVVTAILVASGARREFGSTHYRAAPGLNIFQPQGPVTVGKRDEYVKKMKHQLDELNASMAKLEAKAQVAKDDARDKYKEEMAKLRHQSKLAAAKFDELQAAGEDTWETMVAETEKVRDAFVHSFHYFKSQL